MTEPVCKIHPNGDKEWWLNGKLHRTDGPAVERANGHKEWWLNGQLHRTDGPAVELANGGKEWWLNGRIFYLEEYIMELERLGLKDSIVDVFFNIG